MTFLIFTADHIGVSVSRQVTQYTSTISGFRGPTAHRVHQIANLTVLA